MSQYSFYTIVTTFSYRSFIMNCIKCLCKSTKIPHPLTSLTRACLIFSVRLIRIWCAEFSVWNRTGLKIINFYIQEVAQLTVRFSRILSKLDSIEMSLWFEKSVFKSFLSIGTTTVIFSTEIQRQNKTKEKKKSTYPLITLKHHSLEIRNS